MTTISPMDVPTEMMNMMIRCQIMLKTLQEVYENSSDREQRYQALTLANELTTSLAILSDELRYNSRDD